MQATFICAICGERMTTNANKIPEYCPFCGANKKMKPTKRSKVNIDEARKEYDDASAAFDEAYKAVCLAYTRLVKAYQTKWYLVKKGKLPAEEKPKMRKVSIVADSRYFAEMEGKANV